MKTYLRFHEMFGFIVRLAKVILATGHESVRRTVDLQGRWSENPGVPVVKLIYSEKATKFCEIFTLLLSYVVPVKSTVKIAQNVLAFSEYMNFSTVGIICPSYLR